MQIATPAAPAGTRTLGVPVVVLVLGQIIGWGTTFHVPAVLSARIGAGTGLSAGLVFGGITIMLLVAAAISPLAGRLLDRDGCRRWMVAGSALVALGLVLLSCAQGPVSFAAAWIVFGFAMPFALNQGASTALVQLSPRRARTTIAFMLLFTGLSSTVAWPTLIWLDGLLGWRRALLVCAGVNILVALPLHAAGLPPGRPLVPAPDGDGGPSEPAPASRPVPGAYALTAVTFSIAGALTWGLPLHLIGILQDYGHPETSAVAIGALIGPGQVLARAFEMAGGGRIGILTVGVGAAALMPVALLALLLWGATPAGAVAFTVGYGLSAGLISVVRAVAPLRLFGAVAYALVLGRLGVPQNMAFAAAPLGFAALREWFGVAVLTSVSLGLAVVCLATLTTLAWRVRATA